MPAVSLCCRICATEHPLDATGTCSRCFGPLDPTYDWDALRARVSRASIEAGPQSIWRYADLLPVAAPAEARLAPGMTPLVPAPRLAAELGIGELWLKLDTANPTHSFKDRVVAVAAREGAGARARHALVLVDRQPRRRGRRARRGRGPGRRGLRPEPTSSRRSSPQRPCTGRRIYAVDGTYDHCSRLSRRAVVRAAVGLRQRQPPLVLRRGLEDARLRDRRAARLGDPRRRRDPDRLGRALPQGRPGLRGARTRSASSTAPSPALFGGQAAGLRAGRDRLPRGHARGAGAPATHRALARDRQPCRRRLRRHDGAGDGRRDPHGRRGRDRREHGPPRRDDGRLRRDGHRRHARRAAGGRRRRRRSGRTTRVVLLVTGDGLKTPGPGLRHLRSRSRSRPTQTRSSTRCWLVALSWRDSTPVREGLGPARRPRRAG